MNQLDGQLVLTAGLLTTFTIELVKYVVRKFVMKDDNYDFPPTFYDLLLPFITALWTIVLGYVGWADPVSFDPMSIVQWGLTIVVSVGLYVMGVKPATSYAKEYEKRKAI